MRLRLVIAGSMIVLLAACGSGDGSGAQPTISASLSPDASIVRPTGPPGTDAATPPADTRPPETQPAAPPEEAAPAATAPSSTVAPGDNGDDTVWWPWVLGALLVIGVIVAIVAMARRRPRGPSWQNRTTTMLDEIEQLTNHLAAVSPAGLRTVAQADAMSLATMRATLDELVSSAPHATSQMALKGLTTPLAELHGAVTPSPCRQTPQYLPTAPR